MIYSASSERRSFTKVRGSKRLAVEAGDRQGRARGRDDPVQGSGDPRREDPAGGHLARRLLADASGG